VPLGRYIADFVCFEARLIVEVDGPVHGRPMQKERDLRRDVWFAESGFSVVRISGEAAIGALDIALARIARALARSRLSRPSLTRRAPSRGERVGAGAPHRFAMRENDSRTTPA
jgi:very-short-patch-repair endonuclease